MIPKVKLFDYYYWSSNMATEDDCLSFIQLIAHTDDFHTNTELPNEKIRKLKRYHRLLILLLESQWGTRNGQIRYFLEFENFTDFKNRYNELADLLSDFNLLKSINLIKETIQFYERNTSKIIFLKNNYEHSDWDNIMENLESKYDLYYAGEDTEILAQKIIKNPSDFCVDENGKSISENYTGDIQTYFSNGNVNEKYSVINGKIYGEYISYYPSGKQKQISVCQGRKYKIRVKGWYENGNIEFHQIDKEECKFWYENGQLKLHKVEGIRYKWDKEGNKK